jgi:mannonate dehydratase
MLIGELSHNRPEWKYAPRITLSFVSLDMGQTGLKNMAGSFSEVQGGSASMDSRLATPLRQKRVSGSKGIIITELFRPDEQHKIRLAAQIGIRHAIVDVKPVLQSIPNNQYAPVLRKIKKNFGEAGLEFIGVESHPVPAEKIKLGLPGRDEEIENYLAVIRALAQVGVRIVCYNWMAGIGWYRTKTDLSGRGGALISEFDQKVAEKQGLTEWGEVSEQKIWSNLEYFLRAVIPVAGREGVKMALHPDDPPLSPLRGIGRILTSAANYRRVLKIVPSPVNGITFCQANFKLMGEDVAGLVKEWTKEKKIFFVHLRDVEGTREHFCETFHDNGPVDLAQMLRIYHKCGFEGPLRPDHAPTLDGEANDRPGYAVGGKVFAIGYMKGAMDALGIPHS